MSRAGNPLTGEHRQALRSPGGTAEPWRAVPLSGLQELKRQHFSLLTSP